MNIDEVIKNQREYFAKGETYSVDYRIAMLKKLYSSVKNHESEIGAALKADLGKNDTEAFICETGLVLSELSYMLKHLRGWARPHRRASSLVNFHSGCSVVNNPYGIVLIMSPWNYPFLLTMVPLIGAMSGGNCCVVKPSAYSANTSKVIKMIINECFDEEYIAVIEGGRQENQTLLSQKFDYIFFTGSVNVGKEVMRHAAENLTPVTLELGGKSPCIVDKTANLEIAARRIAFGKLLNCGQTCVAPDYFLVDSEVEDKLIELLKKNLTKMVGSDSLKNENYPHMINSKHFERVKGLIDESKVVYGGKSDPETLRIEPTILKGVTEDDAVMQEEIFGPLIPVISYKTFDEVIDFVSKRAKPLACYLFSNDKRIHRIYRDKLLFGGGCINDTIVHLATSTMGFGGVGESGMGSYHGRRSFETFTHEKSILQKYNWIDVPFRYSPFDKLKNTVFHIFLR